MKRKAKRDPSPPEARSWSERDQLETAIRVAAIPVRSPRELDQCLLDAGYQGQTEARRAIAVLAYQHLDRLRRRFCFGEPVESLGPSLHHLLVGPTGSGKTRLIELAFRDLLQVPTLTVDVTQFSEVGYSGEDVPAILTRLYQAAGQKLSLAACGVVFLDELDKLATSSANSRDVSGLGVQRGLLTLLSSPWSEAPATTGLEGRVLERLRFSLSTVTFVAAGAFSSQRAMKPDGGTLGFAPSGAAARRQSGALWPPEDELVPTLTKAGLTPELLGRFARVVRLAQLDESDLRALLVGQVLTAQRTLFAQERVELEVAEPVVRVVVQKALRSGTGARGLHSALRPALEHAAFELFGRGGRATLELDDERVVARVETG
jgi:ATP-dependent Clp protease ATP-binding subunit ClpX